MELIRFNAPHGAEIRNLDLSQPMSEETVESVRSAWHENPVLLFRGQNLDDQQLMALARNFGELELPPSRLLLYSHGSGQKERRAAGDQRHLQYRRRRQKDRTARCGRSEMAHGYRLRRKAAGRKFPSRQGTAAGRRRREHILPKSYDAYEALPDDLRKKVEDRWSKHDPSYTSDGVLREGFQSLQRSFDGPRTCHPTRTKTSGDGTQKHSILDGGSIPVSSV